MNETKTESATARPRNNDWWESATWPLGPAGFWASAAVANRIRAITELLDMDFEDPDQRFVLQFACRARLLGWPSPARGRLARR
jgi:hypothetical protein